MAPATEFVEDFVGADRALKRLALMRVADIDLWEAPLAYVGQADRRGAGEAGRARRRSALPAAGRQRAPSARLALASATSAADDRAGQARLAARARCSTATTSCATPSPTCSRARPSTRPWSTTKAGSTACSRSRSSPSSSNRRRRRRRSTAPWSGPMASPALLLAAVGEVGKGFIQERSSDTLPCQANDSHLFCWDWAQGKHRPLRDADVAAPRTRPDLGRARLRRRLRPGPARPPPPLAAAAAAGRHRRPLHDPQHRLLLPAAAVHRPRPRHRDHRPQRLHAADHLPQHDRRPRQRPRARSRTPPAAWA